jgi:hypothetical protein
VNTSTLCIDADVHTLRAVDELIGDEVIAPFNVADSLPGAQFAVSRLAEVVTQLGYSRIEIGYEATGMLWGPFHRPLSATPAWRGDVKAGPGARSLPKFRLCGLW